MQQLSTWLAGFPGLIWSVDIPRSRLKAFNRWHFADLDAPRFLKDALYRKKRARREDYPLLMEFWDMLATRRPVAVTFYLNDVSTPLILRGWPGTDDDISYGFLTEAFLPVAYAAGSQWGTCQMDLGRVGYPVFAVEMPGGAVLTANAAARELFGAAEAEQPLCLEDVAPGELAKKLLEAAAQALEDDVWAGTLSFGNAPRGIVSAKVRLTPCDGGAVRVALLNIPSADRNPAPPPASPLPAAADGVSLREGLNALLARHADDLDGLMFSDIQSARGRVVVYGVGPAFADLAWGAEHAYEGSIAQDMERFGLHSLTVEDTLDSIKSIDWVLFAPHGVRSYYALPLYAESGLHAVLILVTRRPGAFDPDAERRFADLPEPFERLVAAWRRS